MHHVKHLPPLIFCLLFSMYASTFAPCSGQSGTPAGRVWTHQDQGMGWIPEKVSIGNYGTQVFTHYFLNNTGAALLSRHDVDPPTPIWEVFSFSQQPTGVDSAKWTDIHVAVTQEDSGVPNKKDVRILKFSSQQGPDWEYDYPSPTSGKTHVQVSNDGGTIAATVKNPSSGANDLLVFSPDSSTPVAVHPVPGTTMWSFHLSADGTRAVCGIDTAAYVLDVSTGATLFTLHSSQSLSNVGLALSGDGTILAAGGGPGTIRIYQWTGSTYTKIMTDTTPGNGLVRRIAVSDDAGTVAFGIGYPSPSTTVHIKAIDVASKTVTMEEVVSSSGQYSNTVSDVAISADGQRFAAALLGDEPDLVEEIRIFDKHQNNPLMVLNLPGSAYSVDISLDGKWVAAGSKAVHANKAGNGGQVDLLHLGGLDFVLLKVPSLGNTVTLDLYGPAGASAMPLLSLGLAPIPTYIPGIGTFYLDPGSMIFLADKIIDPQGKAAWDLVIPYDVSLIGTSTYFQGLIKNPKKLTDSWIKMTVVP